MSCQICLGTRRVDVFKTGRIAICRPCITLLNENYLTQEQAEDILDEYLRNQLRQWDTRTIGNPSVYAQWQIDGALERQSPTHFEAYFEQKRGEWLNRLLAGNYNSWLSSEQRFAAKLLRAHRRSLLRAHLFRNTDYPVDWKASRAPQVRAQDGNACRQCGKTWEAGITDLNVHHIVHKANGGSHNPKNLVTLCHECHSKEHPELEDFMPTARAFDETVQPVPALDANEAAGITLDSLAEPVMEVSDTMSPHVDPDGTDRDMMEDLFIVAGAHIEAGAVTFEAYADAMIEDLGDFVIPYLRAPYESVRYWPDFIPKGMTSPSEADRLHAEMLNLPKVAEPALYCSPTRQRERKLIEQAGTVILRQIAERIRTLLMDFPAMLSGDANLKNVWNEICVQKQGQESWDWYAYEAIIHQFARGELDELPKPLALLLSAATDEGDLWLDEPDGDEIPLFYDVVVQDIVNALLEIATNEDNSTVKAFLSTFYEDESEF